MEFKQPPILKKENGEARKAGFELEYGGVGLDLTSSCIIELYGGSQNQINKFHRVINDTSLGKFTIKFDSKILTEKKYEGVLEKFGINAKEHDFDNLAESIASLIVPYEIDTPPVPFNEVYKLDLLRKALYDNKARGTTSSVLYAYATHINAELPALNVETILKFTRAFLLLYPWIFQKAKIDLTRRLSHYINPFPEDYIKLVLQPGYNPDLETFIEDYHKYNPDRNRPFDLYPVLAYISKDIIGKMEGIGSVKPRPTFHYRLPNSLMDVEGWTLASEWNCWIAIENLASDVERIRNLSREYLEAEEHTFIGFNNKWIKRTEEWVEC